MNDSAHFTMQRLCQSVSWVTEAVRKTTENADKSPEFVTVRHQSSDKASDGGDVCDRCDAAKLRLYCARRAFCCAPGHSRCGTSWEWRCVAWSPAALRRVGCERDLREREARTKVDVLVHDDVLRCSVRTANDDS